MKISELKSFANISKITDFRLTLRPPRNRDFGGGAIQKVLVFGYVSARQVFSNFWSGFQTIKKRLKDNTDTPMLLKLKDWPPTEDIANYMPRRFNDIINSYPLHEYTHR